LGWIAYHFESDFLNNKSGFLDANDEKYATVSFYGIANLDYLIIRL